MKKDWKTMSKEELIASSQQSYELHMIPDGEGTYIAVWPELPGCASCGSSMQETLAKAEENKTAWFKAMILKAFSEENLEQAAVYENDDPDEVEKLLESAGPEIQDLAIKDTLINEGDAVILVRDEEEKLNELILRLEDAGFDEEDIHPELPASGLYVNLYFEVFAVAREGIRIASPFRQKAVTADDFERIASIYARTGSLEEDLSDVDKEELKQIYSDPDDPTFGELIEQYSSAEESSISDVRLYAGNAVFDIPGEWKAEIEEDGSGFFCTNENGDSEFSAYYTSVDLARYNDNEQIFTSLSNAYIKEMPGLVQVLGEAYVHNDRDGMKYTFASPDGSTEITRIVLLDGLKGLVQIEYRIPSSTLSYELEIMEKVLNSIRFNREDDEND